MRKAMIDQKLKRPIGDRWLFAKAFCGKPFEHLIGAHRPVRLKQDFQHTPPHRRKARALPGCNCLGAGQQAVAAMRMVVLFKGEVR